ncbi:MAG: NYN domain-containing protein [Treponema sp.]|jgi:uncharacterized LabA/DUF88 family protein|nr:NYN domain-containing protein [Treponema sp.]
MDTIWIIDGAYMMKSGSNHGKIDYMRLKQFLEKTNETDFRETYYLNSTANLQAEQSFHNWLKSAPPHGPKMRVKLYDLKRMNLKCISCGNEFDREVQKGVDVGIATLMIKLACQNQYNRLILSAGDGDFEDAIDYVKSDLHKEIWIAAFDGSVSLDLQSYADRVLWLNDYWEEIKKNLVVRPELALYRNE